MVRVYKDMSSSKAAHALRPWLDHMKSVREQLAEKGIHGLPQSEIAKLAKQTYIHGGVSIGGAKKEKKTEAKHPTAHAEALAIAKAFEHVLPHTEQPLSAEAYNQITMMAHSGDVSGEVLKEHIKRALLEGSHTASPVIPPAIHKIVREAVISPTGVVEEELVKAIAPHIEINHEIKGAGRKKIARQYVHEMAAKHGAMRGGGLIGGGKVRAKKSKALHGGTVLGGVHYGGASTASATTSIGGASIGGSLIGGDFSKSLHDLTHFNFGGKKNMKKKGGGISDNVGRIGKHLFGLGKPKVKKSTTASAKHKKLAGGVGHVSHADMLNILKTIR